MQAPRNAFKAALREGRLQTGLWLALADAYTAEICGGAGFDWLLIDGEHAPNDLRSILAQLQALGSSPSHPIVRPPIGNEWTIKQLLDIGAQTILVPMVETGEQAAALGRAMRYPPNGRRGVGAGLARASDFNRRRDYLCSADDQVCLLVQVESRAGMAALDEIADAPGVDGVFVGPADLAADMSHLGDAGHPEVVEVVEQAIRRIVSHGKPAGVLTGDQALAPRYREAGATFIALGSDVGLLGAQAAALAKLGAALS